MVYLQNILVTRGKVCILLLSRDVGYQQRSHVSKHIRSCLLESRSEPNPAKSLRRYSDPLAGAI